MDGALGVSSGAQPVNASDKGDERGPRTIRIAVETLVGLSVIALTLLACVNVVLRYLFSTSLIWMEDASVLVLIWMVWIGAVLLWFQRGHLAIDFLPLALRSGGRTRLRQLSELGAVVGCLALAYASMQSYRGFAGIEIMSLEMDSTVKFHPVVIGALGIFVAALMGLAQTLRRRGK